MGTVVVLVPSNLFFAFPAQTAVQTGAIPGESW